MSVETEAFSKGREAMAELVCRIRSGSATAEAELVDRFSHTVALLLRRLTRNNPTAEDLHQETFQLVIEKLRAGELREAARLPGFVISLAKNRFLGATRRGIRRQRWLADPDAAEATPDPAPGQLAFLLDRERDSLVHRVLDDLAIRRDREILVRFYIAGETKEAICRALDLSDLHFNRVLFRARQRYRELFEKAALTSSQTRTSR